MIQKFDASAALLLIDVQKGVNDTAYYGGAIGERNNLDAEKNILSILSEWRGSDRQVAFTKHNSREKNSPLKLSLESGQQLEGMEPMGADIVVEKDVNSGFIGTSLEIDLRRAGIQRLVVVGFFTNFCIETTVRMAGNMGFDTYLVHDACATMDLVGHDGKNYNADLVHNVAIASLHGEFCTAISTKDVLHLCSENAEFLNRVQGNE
ncbi:MAG: isochorismatase family protein [Proteobacteria bacterium]|jgi:nicotinamidase-related amidase|nr:isochorismatase family protein [Pseudomonadota bacterium]